jgi:guanine nucleotide-binding protein G(i) subunit alpha
VRDGRQRLHSCRSCFTENHACSGRVLVDGVALLAIPIDVSCQPFAQTILGAPGQLDGGPLDPAYVAAVQKLWADRGIRAAYERRSELQLNDSAEYFFTQVARLSAQAYRPTDEDILRARVKSTGISEVMVRVDTLMYRMFDVGGQRSVGPCLFSPRRHLADHVQARCRPQIRAQKVDPVRPSPPTSW